MTKCIVHTDMSGMTAAMADGSFWFVDQIFAVRKIIEHHLSDLGQVVHHIGDSTLLMFLDKEPMLTFLKSVSTATTDVSYGAACGKVAIVGGDVFGHAVNVASKLGEDVGEPGQILFEAELCSGGAEFAAGLIRYCQIFF